MRTTCLVLLAGLALHHQAAAQEGAGPYGTTYSVSTLAEGVHTLTWTVPPGSPAIGNATFIVGRGDVIVVDTGVSRAAGEAILAALRRITDKPVSLVINTHWHADHIFGNQAFRAAFPQARFVSHAATRDGIVAGEVDYRVANRPKTEARRDALRSLTTRSEAEERELARADLQLQVWEGEYVLPELLLHERLTLIQDDRRIDLRHLGLANTAGDLVIVLPAERVAITGDMAITPVPFAFFSSPRAWIDTLDRLAALEADVLVPGHGPPQRDRRFVRDLQAMLRDVVRQVDEGLRAGLDLAALKARVVVTPPPGSVYAGVAPRTLDAMFRVPAIESAVKEAR